MAYPITTELLTNYSGGNTPPVYAEDLNDVQQYLARVYQGTRTVIALTVDGTGDTTVVPTAGRITASENVQAGGDVTAGDDVIATDAVTAGGDLTSRHILAGGSAPTVVVDANLGTGRSATITAGKDSSHLLNVLTGTGTSVSGGTDGAMAVLTYNTAFAATARAVPFPANQAAADLRGIWIDCTANGYTLRISPNARAADGGADLPPVTVELVDSTLYLFNVIVFGST